MPSSWSKADEPVPDIHKLQEIGRPILAPGDCAVVALGQSDGLQSTIAEGAAYQLIE